MPAKKNEEEAAKATNGRKKSSSPPAASAASSGSGTSTSTTDMTIFVALVAFLLGVLSPPSFHTARHVATEMDLSPPSSSAATTASGPQSPKNFRLLPHYTPCTPSNLANFVHDTPVPGLHIVCIEALNFDATGKAILSSQENNNDQQEEQTQHRRRLYENISLRFTFLKNSVTPTRLYQRKKLTGREGNSGGGGGGVQSIDWDNVKQLFIQELELIPEGPLQQPWAIFTPEGQRIIGQNDVLSKDDDDDDDQVVVGSNAHILQTLAASGMVLVFQGGNWRWPGVREGFKRTIELSPTLMDLHVDSSPEVEMTEKRNITIETLSMTPLVISIQGFLSEEECDHIAELAAPRMQYSGVSLKDVDKGKAASNWRTSQSAFLSSVGDPILTAIDHRTASLSRVPETHQEVLQVLRYGTTEKYDAHHDYFDPKHYQSDVNTLNLIQNGKRNRFATVFWYLTTVEKGGETIFPQYDNKPLPRGYVHSDCTIGLKVQPQKGKVIIFYSMDARGQIDPTSLHGACPVIGERDVKWAANKWIWNAPMGFSRSYREE